MPLHPLVQEKGGQSHRASQLLVFGFDQPAAVIIVADGKTVKVSPDG
jgi:hypothetical protein